MPEGIKKETVDEIVKRIDENVAEVKEQTLITNGRVTKLEQWKWKLNGAVGVVIVLLIPVVLMIVKHYLLK